MAQAASLDQTSSDPSLGAEQPEGKTSLFGKIKNKTKDKTKRLRNKMPGNKSGSERTGEEADTSSSGSEDEAESPINNHMTGMSQPEYEKSLKDGTYDDSGPATSEVSPSVPSSNFPGNFSNVAARDEEDDSGLSKDFEGLSTGEKIPTAGAASEGGAPSEGADEYNSKSTTENLTDSLTSAKDTTVQKLSGEGSEQQFMSPDSPADKAGEVTDKAADAGKSWSQWAAEKVGYAKDAAAANVPTTAEGKPVTDKAYESAVAAKDTVHEQAVKPAYDQTAATANTVASKADDYHSSIPSDPAQQSYVQKATSGIYAAKDSIFSSTQPADHDKALSQKVSESVGNLPATFKSSLGFGGSKPSSPTTTPAVPTDFGTSSDAPESPGLVSRFTSLFAAKKPHEESSPASDSAPSESATDTATN